MSISTVLQNFVEYNVKNYVDKPEVVEITTSVSTKAIIIQIRVDQSDCGKVIGKEGENITALKRLCLATKNTKFPSDYRKIMIEVLEDEDSNFIHNSKFGG